MTKAERAVFRTALAERREAAMGAREAALAEEVAELDDEALASLVATAEAELREGWDLPELSIHMAFALEEAHSRGLPTVLQPKDGEEQK